MQQQPTQTGNEGTETYRMLEYEKNNQERARANGPNDGPRPEEGGATGGGVGGTRKGGLTDTVVNPSDYPSGDSPLQTEGETFSDQGEQK